MLTSRRAVLLGTLPLAAAARRAFPGAHWQTRDAASDPLDRLANELGGRGCVVVDGVVVKQWGAQDQVADVLSSAKPILSTLLFMAIHEKKWKSVDEPIASLGWEFEPKDRGITFRHLGGMTSGYARPEGPGQAWAYNDFAIQLYQKSLFDRVFREEPQAAAMHPKRFGALGLEDGLAFRAGNRRISASVRDFARIAWFWLNKGRWGNRELLPKRMFDEYMKPQTRFDLPHTAKAETRDYLGLGTYGGGSNHFTPFGGGIYGFNWWFNRTGRLHPDRPTWPGAPADTIMSIGARGNNSAIVPSLGAVLVAMQANWGEHRAGDPESPTCRHLRLLADAVRALPRK